MTPEQRREMARRLDDAVRDTLAALAQLSAVEGERDDADRALAACRSEAGGQITAANTRIAALEAGLAQWKKACEGMLPAETRISLEYEIEELRGRAILLSAQLELARADAARLREAGDLCRVAMHAAWDARVEGQYATIAGVATRTALDSMQSALAASDASAWHAEQRRAAFRAGANWSRTIGDWEVQTDAIVDAALAEGER